MTLFEKQKAMPKKLCLLFLKAEELGYEITIGEAYRPHAMAEIYAKEGKGIIHSLHCDKLAFDLNLFKDDKFLIEKSDYEPLGLYWESLSSEDIKCSWGGHFGDSDHFSIEDSGRR